MDIEYELFGFMLGTEVQIDIQNNRMVRISNDKYESGAFFGVSKIKDASMRLLVYLLLYARENPVSKSDIMYSIWERYHLSASSQRLWEVMKELKIASTKIGLPEDFIIKTRGHEYQVNYECITPIYMHKIKKSCIDSFTKPGDFNA